MRYAILAVPFVAAAFAQDSSSDQTSTVVPIVSGTQTVSTTVEYSNPATKYLTETNSDGVVTGMPGAATQNNNQPTLMTSQPAVATIPAGLPNGYHTIPYNGSSLISFTVSVGSSTTINVGGANVPTTIGSSFVPAGQTGGHGGNGPQATGTNSNNNNNNNNSNNSNNNGNGNNGSNNQASASGSASASSTSPGAASNVKVASAGMGILGALFAALL